MSKRKLSGSPNLACQTLAVKRQRIEHIDRLSGLSDELLLRIYAYTSVSDLAVSHRVSRRIRSIARDSQLWRAAYYDRFVRPRFNRLPKTRRSTQPSKLARWLDESSLVERGRAINWKRQYKLRHKWSQGICDISEIPVASRPAVPPILARLHDGIVYTVDANAGLRAWSYRGQQELLASHSTTLSATADERRPTSFAVDTKTHSSGHQRLIVGFEDGSFSIYSFDRTQTHFVDIHTHPASSNGMVTAMAFASPYILSMSEGQHLSLYRLDGMMEEADSATVCQAPRLLSSLKSHTVWPPLSLSLRVSDIRITASIAYSMPTFTSGWTAGIQELHIAQDGTILDSRIASAAGQGFSIATHPARVPVLSKPTSLSYSHPYLLVSHADNTLTLYMVHSTATEVTISPGKRLWGHTSSVFGAHVAGRGKAVSVSTRGNEIRVWELEGSTLADAKADTLSESSVQVSPEKRGLRRTSNDAQLPLGGSCSLELNKLDESDITRGWVGFDDESVVVLRERDHGRQALAVYDFA